MEVPNKWRAFRFVNGKEVVGTLTRRGIFAAIANKDGVFRVQEDTLQKLAGYDENGNEVWQWAKRTAALT